MKKAFTLIELLIVVSIIGILAVTLIPRLTDAPARAKDVAIHKMAKEVVERLEAFNIDYGHYPANQTCLRSTTAASPNETQTFIIDYLENNPPHWDLDPIRGYCRNISSNTHEIFYRPYEGGYYIIYSHRTKRSDSAEATDVNGVTYYNTRINRY